MKRRDFLKNTAFGLASICAGTACARGETKSAPRAEGKRSRVALVRRQELFQTGSELDEGQLSSMLQKVLALALGTAQAEEGLAELFRGHTVGIKLNCLAGPTLSPRPQLCKELVALLGRAGVPPERIIFFERAERDLKKGGFEPRYSGGPLFLGHDSPGVGYEEEVSVSGRVGSCLSRVLTRKITALINFGVLKDHNLAGVAAAVKNLYGLIHNPNKFHDSNCDPYLADVLAFPEVQKKLKLNILDAITAQCHGGPGYLPGHAWNFGGLLASTDPVALDTVAWDIIEKQRRATGLKSLEEEKRAPRWLRTAAERGLGRASLAEIDLVEG